MSGSIGKGFAEASSMKENINVSIIVPTLEGISDALKAALNAQNLEDWELVEAKGIRPAARARNTGAAKARGEWLIFVDDDVQFNHSHVLKQVKEILEASANTFDAVNVLWTLAPDANWIQKAQVDMSMRPKTEDSDTVAPISWRDAGTACFAVRRSAFEALGGFDENLISGEDCDLAYRLTQRGGAIYSPGNCRVVHKPAATLIGAFKKTLWYEWGNAQVAIKHPEAGYRIRFRNPLHLIAYLFARTLALVPLWFVRISYHHRRPSLTFRPVQACLSYVGAWAYGASWMRHSRQPGVRG